MIMKIFNVLEFRTSSNSKDLVQVKSFDNSEDLQKFVKAWNVNHQSNIVHIKCKALNTYVISGILYSLEIVETRVNEPFRA